MSAANDRLAASVHGLTSAVNSAVAVIGDLAQRIRDTAGNEAAANALADEVDADKATLAAAIAANTGADPAVAPPPPPAESQPGTPETDADPANPAA